ncbi:hypothetical protein GQ457_03G036580 [Hibiscus cannabinus]
MAMGIDQTKTNFNCGLAASNYQGNESGSAGENFSRHGKRESRDREQNSEVVMVQQPNLKRTASIEEDGYDVFEFQDRGSDYLESLLSSF